jgi:hypothetical protein
MDVLVSSLSHRPNERYSLFSGTPLRTLGDGKTEAPCVIWFHLHGNLCGGTSNSIEAVDEIFVRKLSSSQGLANGVNRAVIINRLSPKMKPKLTRKKRVTDKSRFVGTLTTRSIKSRRTPKAQTYDSLGTTEIHRVAVIELKPEDRARLQNMAKRYRVNSLTRFFEGCLSAEDQHANPGIQVLFRIYEG